MRSWIDYWNTDTPIYVNARHKQLHYQGVANDIRALLKPEDRVVLDYGCGEALSASDVAGQCDQLILCDAADNVRAKLAAQFRSIANISVISTQEVEALEDNSLDLIIANSMLQYVTRPDLEHLLDMWKAKLKPSGRLVLADIIPPAVSPITDASALLNFGLKGGFLMDAFIGLVRTALSDYRKIRSELGLSTYSEPDMKLILDAHGFKAERRSDNIGHNQARMCFEAIKVS